MNTKTMLASFLLPLALGASAELSPTVWADIPDVDPSGLVDDGRQAEGQPKGVMCVPGMMEESASGNR